MQGLQANEIRSCRSSTPYEPLHSPQTAVCRRWWLVVSWPCCIGHG